MRVICLSILIISVIMVSSIYSIGLKGRTDDYVYVVADRVNVREQPSINSKSIMKLRIGTLVKIIKRINRKENVNNIIGEWIYIDTLSYNFSKKDKTTKGWVFDYYFGNLDGAVRITSFNNYKLEVTLPDHSISFIFHKNGTYVRKPFANEKARKISGKLYRYRDLIIGKDDNNSDNISYFIFYLKNNERLCMTEGMDYCVEKIR